MKTHGIGTNFIPEEEKEQYVILYNQGISCTKISKIFNRNRDTISINLKRKGIKVENKQNKVKFNERMFDDLSSEEQFYWLGFIAADGYVGDNGKIELSLSDKDTSHLIKFNKFSQHINNNVKINNASYNKKRCRWSIKNQYLKNRLIELGITPRKSNTYTYNNIFDNNFLTFLRGYFDGDGCISGNKTANKVYPQITLLGTKEFLIKVKEILYTKYNIISYLSHQKSNGKAFNLRISRKSSIPFLDLLYNSATIYLDRKYKRYQFFKNCRPPQEWDGLLLGKNGEG